MATTTNRGTSPRKEATMATTLPTTMGEIARVALSSFAQVPTSVTIVHVLTTNGEVPMTRSAAEFWAVAAH